MPTCDNDHPETEMELEDVVTDFHDPSDAHGHGQYESQVYVCPICERITNEEGEEL